LFPERRAGAWAAVLAACLVNGSICAVTKPLAPDFILLTQPVVLFWTFVGGIGILATYRWLTMRSHHPFGWLLAASAAALILTILPDIGLLLWTAPWFGPYTAPGVWVLILLHATCAATILLLAPLWLQRRA
jgi:hypothetical protein